MVSSLQAKVGLSDGYAVKLKSFSWSSSAISRLFKGTLTAENFCKVWEERIAPHLASDTGILNCDAAFELPGCGVNSSASSQQKSSTSKVAGINTSE